MNLRNRRLKARDFLERNNHHYFKNESSAKFVDIKRLKNGALIVEIQHDSIKNVSPTMIKWFFENLARVENIAGEEISFYHLWHHRDHIAIKVKNANCKGFTVGEISTICEQFNDYNEKINNTMLTTKLDENEFTFEILWHNLKVGKITHIYQANGNNVEFYAQTKIGVDIPFIGYFINYCLLPFKFSKKTAQHWIKHNIEETGQTEKILPFLYKHFADK